MEDDTLACGLDTNAPGAPCARPTGHNDTIGHTPVRFPQGTPEYAAYAADLRRELATWVLGDLR